MRHFITADLVEDIHYKIILPYCCHCFYFQFHTLLVTGNRVHQQKASALVLLKHKSHLSVGQSLLL